jgi:hypothetical protein
LVNCSIGPNYFSKDVKILRNSLRTLQAFLSLSILHSFGCKSIGSLLTMIGQWQHLTKLCLQRCENFKEIPHCIASLSSLSILYISHYNSLNHYQQQLVNCNIWPYYYCEDVKILKSFLKALQTFFHYQYWTYVAIIPLNHY